MDYIKESILGATIAFLTSFTTYWTYVTRALSRDKAKIENIESQNREFKDKLKDLEKDMKTMLTKEEFNKRMDFLENLVRDINNRGGNNNGG